MGALLTSFFAAVSSFFRGLSIAEFTLTRTLWIALFTVVLPYVLTKLGTSAVSYLVDFVVSQFSSNLQPVIYHASGLAAWLLDCFQVPYCISLILSGFALRYTLKIVSIVIRAVA